VAVGDRIVTSMDATNWIPTTAPDNLRFRGVAFGDRTFVAVDDSSGASGKIFASNDGEHWVETFETTSGGLQRITFGAGVFVAIGPVEVLVSDDGTNWVSRSLPTPTRWRDMTFGNGVFVIVGAESTSLNAGILTSNDGLNWSERTSHISGDLSGVTYGHGMFVANGWRQIAISTDGQNWSPRDALLLGGGLGDIAYGNNSFVVVRGVGILQSDPIVTLGLTGAHDLSIFGMEGRTYGIEANANLNSTNGWQTLTTLTVTNSPVLWRDGASGLNQRFYRAVLIP